MGKKSPGQRWGQDWPPGDVALYPVAQELAFQRALMLVECSTSGLEILQNFEQGDLPFLFARGPANSVGRPNQGVREGVEISL